MVSAALSLHFPTHGVPADNAEMSSMTRHNLALLLTICCLLPACQNKETASAAASPPASAGPAKPAAEANGAAARANRPQVVTTTLTRLENVQ